MSDIDVSRERIERLYSLGNADYIHLAMVDKIEAISKERDELRKALTFALPGLNCLNSDRISAGYACNSIDLCGNAVCDERGCVALKVAKAMEALATVSTPVEEK